MATRKRKGLFITLEGIEGVGKSTHCVYLRRLFERAGRRVVCTREPGGTGAGERIRELLLFRGRGHSLDARTELLLIFTARQQHLSEVILPALRAGKVVISDRFTDSTYAYQGGGHGIPAAEIRSLERWVQRGLKPHLTILLDAPPRIGLARAGRRAHRDTDWFESRTIPFFQRVRRGYMKMARSDPRRVKVIDARGSIEEIQAEMLKLMRRKRWI